MGAGRGRENRLTILEDGKSYRVKEEASGFDGNGIGPCPPLPQHYKNEVLG